MAQQAQPVRWVRRPKESPAERAKFDHYLRQIVDQLGYERETDYFGIVDIDRAEVVRGAFRRSGKRLGVAVKAYRVECTGCGDGGPECRYHLKVTVYDLAVAREYKRREVELRKSGWPTRSGGTQ